MDEILDNEPQSEQNNFKLRAIYIWLSVLVLGILFKLMHWPGNAILIILSTAGLQAYCFNWFLKNKNQFNSVVSILGLVWLLVLIWGIFFNGGHPYNIVGLAIYGIVFSLYFIVYYLIFKTKSK
ncbi:MAG: hypothetical protein ABJG68_13995 [Crocinitomicaceae bacterium]